MIRETPPRSYGQTPPYGSLTAESSAPFGLPARSVPAASERFTLEFGQPLRSEADAVRFFRLYSRDERPEDIAFADIAPRLLRRDDPAFPLYLPERKRLGLIVFDAADIPKGTAR